VTCDCAEQLLKFQRWRLERAKLSGELVHRQHPSVSFVLIFAHGGIERLAVGEYAVECLRAEFRVMKCVGNP
jgi:hypothetical protein